MADSTMVTEPAGIFTGDQVEILSTQRGEPDWLREQRRSAQQSFEQAPMPTTAPEEWRYTPIAEIVKIDAYAAAPEARPVAALSETPAGLLTLIDRAGEAAGRVVQVDASTVHQEICETERVQGVVFTSLETAVREHPELVQRYLATAVDAEQGKFAAMSTAFWTGGSFLYVPAGVRVELPFRAFRWLTTEGTSVFGRTLVVAERDADVTLVDEVASEDLGAQTLSVGGAEIFAEEGARVHYIAVQRLGEGVVHLTTERMVSGRDARITSLTLALGADVTRSDIRCRLAKPGSHVDLLGLYLADGKQHFDHETLQDHVSAHASSNLLFKGALRDEGRSVFRGLIRVHPGAQRTDAYQTNRNLILSRDARADSLPNLEIAADDVRCSHAATVGQMDEEEIFYLLSRGIPKKEAMRLVIFGFFGEVLDQLEKGEVRKELVAAIEKKLYADRG